jgi:hypothetical protein
LKIIIIPPFHSLVVGREREGEFRKIGVEANLCKCFPEICICLSKCTSEAFLLESINYIHILDVSHYHRFMICGAWVNEANGGGRKEE